MKEIDMNSIESISKYKFKFIKSIHFPDNFYVIEVSNTDDIIVYGSRYFVSEYIRKRKMKMMNSMDSILMHMNDWSWTKGGWMRKITKKTII